MKSSRLSDSEERITEAGLQNGSRLAPPNTVLLLVRGSELHKRIPIGITIRPVAFNQDVKALISREGVDPQFLLYWLLAHRDLLLSKVEHTGIGAGKLDTSVVQSLPVMLPDLPEQEGIARFFKTIDDKIELNRRMNETLEAIARAIFKSWFVEFDPVRAKAHGCQPAGMSADIAALFPSKFVNSALGAIPAGWRVCAIKELAVSIQYGFTQSASPEKIGPKFLRITDIQGGRVDWSTVPYCIAADEEHEKYQLRPGDVLVARTGASTGENIYLPAAPDAVFASYLVRFQFATMPLARYVGGFMRTPDYFDFVAGSIGGSAQPNASAQTLGAASIVVPSDQLMDHFFNRVNAMDLRCVANAEESTTLTELRDTLLPKLLSGEVRVTQKSETVFAAAEGR